MMAIDTRETKKQVPAAERPKRKSHLVRNIIFAFVGTAVVVAALTAVFMANEQSQNIQVSQPIVDSGASSGVSGSQAVTPTSLAAVPPTVTCPVYSAGGAAQTLEQQAQNLIDITQAGYLLGDADCMALAVADSTPDHTYLHAALQTAASDPGYNPFGSGPVTVTTVNETGSPGLGYSWDIAFTTSDGTTHSFTTSVVKPAAWETPQPLRFSGPPTSSEITG
jgi:hypothetical protein